jgi:hypothetical protein
MATGLKPDLSNLITWGARVWVKVLDVKKLQPRAVEGHFVGYDEESKAYQIYWPTQRKISVERDVYIDKRHVFEPESVQIEGESSDISNAQENSTSQPTAIATATPEPKKDESDEILEPAPIPAFTPPENPSEPRRST